MNPGSIQETFETFRNPGSRNSALWDSYLPEEKIRKNHTQHIRFSFANGSRVDSEFALRPRLKRIFFFKKNGCTSPTPLVYVTFQPWPFPFLFERNWWLVLQPGSLAVLLLRFVLAKGPRPLDISHRSPLAWRKLQKPIIHDVKYI